MSRYVESSSGFGCTGLFSISRVGQIMVFCLILLSTTGMQAAEKAKPLSITDAVSVRDFHVQGVMAAYSPDGKWIATTLCDPEKKKVTPSGDMSISSRGAAYRSMGCDIWLLDAKSGRHRNLTAGEGNNWSPSWSPDGLSLAFYSDRKGSATLWLWDVKSDKVREVSSVALTQWLGLETPQWTPDSRHVVVKLMKEQKKIGRSADQGENSQGTVSNAKDTTLTLYQSPKPTLSDKGKEAVQIAGLYPGSLALVDVVSGEVRQILKETNSTVFRLSPNGKHLAWLESTTDSLAGRSQPFYALNVLTLETGKQRVLATRVLQHFNGALSWSPDSRQLAYTSLNPETEKKSSDIVSPKGSISSGGDLYIANLSGKAEKISGAPDNCFSTDYLPPLWGDDGKFVYVISEDHQLWKASVKRQTAVQLTTDGNLEKGVMLSTPDGYRVGSADRKYLYVTYRNRKTSENGFLQVDRTTGKTSVVLKENKRYGGIFNSPSLSPKGDQIVYLAQSSWQSPDLWVVGTDFTSVKRLTELNPQLNDYHFGRSKIISFRNSDGRALRANVLLPANYRPGKKYPTVVWVYASDAGVSRGVNNFGLVGMSAFNMQMLATRGYAVLWPDIPTRIGSPMQDLMKSVMPALDRVVELGIADPDRLAVMGQSNGGYSTLSLIVQTKRFKAAIMNAGFGDLTAFHGTMGGGWFSWIEHGGGSMGLPPWEAPQRYVQNSPIYYLNRIETPLLMQAGAADLGIIQHSDQVWTGLQRLNKEVIYLRYGGEGHVLASAANLRDYWKRVLDFLNRHLNQHLNQNR